MFKILITDKLSEQGMEIFKKEKDFQTEEHIGKTPASLLRNRQLDARIKSLQTSLERAVADEEYEKAADLRDQIRRIEGGQRV